MSPLVDRSYAPVATVRRAAAATLLLLLLCWPDAVSAQHPGSASLDLDVPRLSFSDAALAPPDSELPPVEADHETRLRSGRALTATGALLLATGVAHLAGFAKDRCYQPEDAPTFSRITGGVVAGMGFVLTLGGGTTLLSVPVEERRRHPKPAKARRGLRIGVTAGLLVLESFLLTTGMVELVACASS